MREGPKKLSEVKRPKSTMVLPTAIHVDESIQSMLAKMVAAEAVFVMVMLV